MVEKRGVGVQSALYSRSARVACDGIAIERSDGCQIGGLVQPLEHSLVVSRSKYATVSGECECLHARNALCDAQTSHVSLSLSLYFPASSQQQPQNKRIGADP